MRGLSDLHMLVWRPQHPGFVRRPGTRCTQASTPTDPPYRGDLSSEPAPQKKLVGIEGQTETTLVSLPMVLPSFFHSCDSSRLWMLTQPALWNNAALLQSLVDFEEPANK